MSTKEPKGQVDFSPPDAGDYAKRIAHAKDSHTPVGGVEMPNMPRLDQPPAQNRHAGVQSRASSHKAMNPQTYSEAVATGQAIPGVGAAYAANQPRGFVPPQGTQPPGGPPMEMSGPDGQPVNPPRSEGGLRLETKKALEAVAQANDPTAAATTKEGETELSKDDEDYITKLGEATTDILRNKERRTYIESRITDELDFEQLLYNQELRQRVPIRKNFIPTFRTPSGAEDLFIKRLIAKDEATSTQYVMDRFATMGLVLGLFGINDKPLPDHLDSNKNPDEKLFWTKYNAVVRYPLMILADLSANFVWFEERVRALMSLEAIRNF